MLDWVNHFPANPTLFIFFKEGQKLFISQALVYADLGSTHEYYESEGHGDQREAYCGSDQISAEVPGGKSAVSSQERIENVFEDLLGASDNSCCHHDKSAYHQRE